MSETFTYVDPTEGCCQITITPGDPLILKSGYFVRADSLEAEPLLVAWARLKLGLTPAAVGGVGEQP